MRNEMTKMTRNGGNSKQDNTARQVQRINDSVHSSEVQKSVVTMITHNKGASWDTLRSPTRTSKGKDIDCFQEDNCSLHLEIYTSMGMHSPVYSAESSIGLVIGTGNLGKYLSDNDV